MTYVYEVGQNCKNHLRVLAGRVYVTYVKNVGINCKNCKRNLRV